MWTAWRTETVIESAAEELAFVLDAQGHSHVMTGVIPPLVYAWSDGVLWHEENVPIGDRSAGGASMAFDHAGVLHAIADTSAFDADGAKLLYATRTGPGAWTIETIDATARNVPFSQLRLVFDSDDNPHALYQVWTLSKHTRHATKGSAGWQVEDVYSDVATNQAAIIDSSDNIHMCISMIGTNPMWGNQAYAIRNASTGIWTREIFDTDGGGNCGLSVDDIGQVHVSYESVNDNLRYGLRDATGWTKTTIYTEDRVNDNDLALDSDGKPHISFMRVFSNPHYASQDSAGNWKYETIDTSENDFAPIIRMDAQDRPHVAFLHGHDTAGLRINPVSSLVVAEPIAATLLGPLDS